MEEWKAVTGFEDYQISNLGRVRSLKKGKGARAVDGILKPSADGSGYLIVNLCKNKTQISKKIHRLVAEAFLPNPLDKKEIDHINRDVTNNSVENLRWATRSENCLNTSKQDCEYHNIGFRVRISRKDLGIKMDKTFLTLQEAVHARDLFLAQIDLTSTNLTRPVIE